MGKKQKGDWSRLSPKCGGVRRSKVRTERRSSIKPLDGSDWVAGVGRRVVETGVITATLRGVLVNRNSQTSKAFPF